MENPTLILMVFTKKDGDFYGRAVSFRECKQFQLVWSRNIPNPPEVQAQSGVSERGEGE